MQPAEYLGWDCGNKTLAYAHYTIDLNLTQVLRDCVSAAELIIGGSILTLSKQPSDIILRVINALLEITNRVFICHTHDVKNLIGKTTKLADVSEIERCMLLARYLKTTHGEYSPHIKTIIEHQPPTVNTITYMVSGVIAAHFSEYNPDFVSPKLKDNISICGIGFKERLAQAVEVAKTKAMAKNKATIDMRALKYRCRKEHAVANYAVICKLWSVTGVCAPQHTRKNKTDDVADAFMSILASIVAKKEFY